MPGSGTDKTKSWIAGPAPVVILVETQIGENVGSVARAMANFGLSQLRLVQPREAWPNPKARMMASGADRILDAAILYDTVEDAIGDCTFLIAATARAHDQAKAVVGAEGAAREMAVRVAAGETVGVMFGRERNGLENHEVGLADRILTLPVNPAFASLNLAQAVVIVGYEWYKLATQGALPFATPEKSDPAPKQQLNAFFASLERELTRVEFFRPEDKRATMTINLRNIFQRMAPTRQDIQTLHGVILSLAEGRKGPARGGILDGEEALMLRTLLAEHGKGKVSGDPGPVRGLSRLLRRNPTDAESAFWEALVKDRRFAGRGFKRQVPIGMHIVDFVSFPLRTTIEIVPRDEGETAVRGRAERQIWLRERGYRVVALSEADIERDLAAALAVLEQTVGAASATTSAS